MCCIMGYAGHDLPKETFTEYLLRTASRGPHQGEQFYGCPNFPRCRRTRPYRGE